MLSRVADSLYWMSRYFERATHCSRVLEANYSLMLNPGKLTTERRWRNTVLNLGMDAESAHLDPHSAMIKLMSDQDLPGSIVSCITSARENASQVREEISSEMWERINALYHEVLQICQQLGGDSDVLRLFSSLREGGYKYIGVTDSSMNHDEGWFFIQLGKYIERASVLSTLLTGVFSAPEGADDLDWVSLLTSCSAFESYCKVYTADLKPAQVAEFLMLNPEFPYTVRYSTEKMQVALNGIRHTSPQRKFNEIERISGRLHASLAYARIDEIMSRDFEKFLSGIVEQCDKLHSALHSAYIDYPIETAFEA